MVIYVGIVCFEILLVLVYREVVRTTALASAKGENAFARQRLSSLGVSLDQELLDLASKAYAGAGNDPVQATKSLAESSGFSLIFAKKLVSKVHPEPTR